MLKKNIDILGFPALLSTVAWQDTRISIKIRQRFLSRHPRDRTNRATSSRRGRDDRHKTKDPGATDDNMATDENDDQRFCLRWNNFQSNIWSQFDVLRCDEDFTDVTIACEGRRVRAHKIILSACSPYFKELFKDNPCSHPIIFMRDVGVEHIAALMEFMYAGEVNISQENLSAFLKIADSLKIRGLSDVPFDRKTGNVAPEVDPPMETSGHHNVSDTKVGPGRLEDVTTPPEREATVKFEPVDFRNDGNTAGDCTVFSECNQEFDCNELGIEQGELGYVKKRYIRDTFPSGRDSRKLHSLDPRPCDECGKVYSNLSNLRQHMKLIHHPTYVTCSDCHRQFKTDLYLRRHVLSAHGYVSQDVATYSDLYGARQTRNCGYKGLRGAATLHNFNGRDGNYLKMSY